MVIVTEASWSITIVTEWRLPSFAGRTTVVGAVKAVITAPSAVVALTEFHSAAWVIITARQCQVAVKALLRAIHAIAGVVKSRSR